MCFAHARLFAAALQVRRCRAGLGNVRAMRRVAGMNGILQNATPPSRRDEMRMALLPPIPDAARAPSGALHVAPTQRSRKLYEMTARATGAVLDVRGEISRAAG